MHCEHRHVVKDRLGPRRPPGIGTTTGDCASTEAMARRCTLTSCLEARDLNPWPTGPRSSTQPKPSSGPHGRKAMPSSAHRSNWGLLARNAGEKPTFGTTLPHSGSAVMDNRCATAPFPRTGELRTKSALSRRLSLWFRIAGRTQIVQLPALPAACPAARDRRAIPVLHPRYLLGLTPEGANHPRPRVS